MDSTLLQTIQDELAKSLPQMQVTALKEFIAKSEVTERDYKMLSQDYEKIKEQNSELQIKCSKLEQLKFDQGIIENGKIKLASEKAEFENEKKLYALKFEYEQKMNIQTLSMFNVVFSNNLVKQKIHDYHQTSISTPGKSTPQGWCEGESKNVTNSGEKTVEIEL